MIFVVLSVIAAIWSIFVLANETKLIFKGHSGFIALI